MTLPYTEICVYVYQVHYFWKCGLHIKESHCFTKFKGLKSLSSGFPPFHQIQTYPEEHM